jgi:hypothetical protein
MLLVFCFTFSGFAQEGDSISKRKPNFGFNLGANYTALYNSNAIDELTINNAPGFRFGVFAEFPISKRWYISPKSELSFNYSSVVENDVKYRVDPYNLNFMAHFKYLIKGYDNNLKPYITFGPNLRTPIQNSFENATYDTKVAFNMDFAFGVQIKTKHVLISPELRFSGGITDIRRNPEGKTLRGSNASFVINFSGN